MHEYCDDDIGYFQWLDDHPGGYVLNVPASLGSHYATLHLSSCAHVRPNDGRAATHAYAKICAEELTDLERWATDHRMTLSTGCGACRRTTRTAGPALELARRGTRAPLPDGRGLIEGPAADRRIVQAWAQDYIRYGAARPSWQQDIRADLRTRLSQLHPAAAQVVHATFVGDKPDDADIENLLLYNIEAFKAAGANGIRFEQGTTVPAAPDGADYPFHYSYELAPVSDGFREWQVVRELASFDWADLGAFAGERKVAQVWLAVKSNRPTAADARLPKDTPFAVTVTIRPPHTKREPRLDLLMKSVFDGVIAAFQAHTSTAVLSDVAARLSTVVPADPLEIARHLTDTTHAVLGTVHQLVRPQLVGGHLESERSLVSSRRAAAHHSPGRALGNPRHSGRDRPPHSQLRRRRRDQLAVSEATSSWCPARHHAQLASVSATGSALWK